MWNFIREFFASFVAEAKRTFAPTASLEIVHEDASTLTLKSNSRRFIVNKRFRHVKSGDQVLAQFDAIESIDVTHRRASDEEPENWSVSLNVKGWFSSVTLGSTRDDVEASITAARISTFTGKRVRSL